MDVITYISNICIHTNFSVSKKLEYVVIKSTNIMCNNNELEGTFSQWCNYVEGQDGVDDQQQVELLMSLKFDLLH